MWTAPGGKARFVGCGDKLCKRALPCRFSVASKSVVLRPQRDSSVTSTASICRAWASAMTLRRAGRQFHARAGFLEGADHIVAGPVGKRSEIPFLTRAGLISSRNRQ
jgi:hypothetical protein